MTQLFIIGNGFDLHHNLSTSYSSFADFAFKNSAQTYNQISALFLASREYMGFDTSENDDDFVYDRWCDFEACLGLLDEESFGEHANEDISEYMEVLGMAEHLINQFIDDIASILEVFRRWVHNIDLDEGKKGNFQFGSSAAFINFNYTETLERYYQIGIDRIYYIHGSRVNNDNLIVGHDESPPLPQSKHDLPDFQHNPFYAYLRKTKKPVEEILEPLKSWLKALPEIKRISVWGHSLGRVDWPYFKAISEIYPSAKWDFSYYRVGELADIIQFYQMLGLQKSNIQAVATLEEFERDKDTCQNAIIQQFS